MRQTFSVRCICRSLLAFGVECMSLVNMCSITFRHLRSYGFVMRLLFCIMDDFTTKAHPDAKRKNDWKPIIYIGVVGYVLSISLQFVGTKWSDAHTASLITSATPAFIVIFARWMLHETMTMRKLSALLLATAGVVVVVGFSEGETTSF